MLISTTFFWGCTSIPLAEKSQDTQAKLFQPDPNKSVVYIYRNEFLGTAVRMDIVVNDILLGETRGGHFMWVTLPPGSHRIVSRAENSDEMELKTEPGKIYYVWQEAKMGFGYARTKLSSVNETTGQSGVRECSLVNHIHPNSIPKQVSLP